MQKFRVTWNDSFAPPLPCFPSVSTFLLFICPPGELPATLSCAPLAYSEELFNVLIHAQSLIPIHKGSFPSYLPDNFPIFSIMHGNSLAGGRVGASERAGFPGQRHDTSGDEAVLPRRGCLQRRVRPQQGLPGIPRYVWACVLVCVAPMCSFSKYSSPTAADSGDACVSRLQGVSMCVVLRMPLMA